MTSMEFRKFEDQIILHVRDRVCETREEVCASEFFARAIDLYLEELKEHDTPILRIFPESWRTTTGTAKIVALLRHLIDAPLSQLEDDDLAGPFRDAKGRALLLEFAQGLYDSWRAFDRFMVLHLEALPPRRTYRTFNDTIERLNHLVRTVFRDLCEHISGTPSSVYRQLPAGCKMGVVATPETPQLPPLYTKALHGIPFARVMWVAPPVMLEPPTNKRGGGFRRLSANPAVSLTLDPTNWLCYPATVGPLTIMAYFHQRFMGLGCALANLFELADEEQLTKAPDAICVFGVPGQILGEGPAFFDDEPNQIVSGWIPGTPAMGYFGYLKKTILLLHNIVMMKRGRLPFHGAMVHLRLRGGASANIAIIGDSGTGKSESLEALRSLGRNRIRELRIVADDMGSMEVAKDGRVIGYGTETGAFVRLDDLDRSYAFKTLDRAIFMSAHQQNARVVLPVTSLRDVLHGYPVDFLLYANNYEECEGEEDILQRFSSPEEALNVFSEGKAMSKGTTTSSGLVKNYFANIFGPPAYRELHDALARRVFEAAFSAGSSVGQLRTQLGVPGCESSGPRKAAERLLTAIEQKGE